MFNEADVDGGSCEQATREHSDEFSDLVHQSPSFYTVFTLLCRGLRSANTNPSRDTVSPTSTNKSCWNIGPAYTKVSNSPFSPQGSMSEGNSESCCSSN